MKRVKFFIFLLPAIIFLFVLPNVVLADSKTLDVTKDTYANEVYPFKVYGSLDHLIVSNKYTTRVVYIQFENPNLPAGAILDSATLNFYVNDVNYADSAKVNIGPITGAWEETAVTWNSKPTINQVQAIESAFSLTAVGARALDVTPLVRLWLEGTENKGLFIYPYGFLYGATETEYAVTFKSKESGTQRANIVVQYHLPEPSPSPLPSPSPSPSPKASPSEIIEEEAPSPTPEESPSPSPEAERGLILGIFSPGQALIAGLILLALIGAGVSFAAYARRKPKKKAKKKPKKKEEAEEEETEEKEEES